MLAIAGALGDFLRLGTDVELAAKIGLKIEKRAVAPGGSEAVIYAADL